MTAAIRLEVAQEKIAEMPDDELTLLSDPDELWHKAYRVGVPFLKLERLIEQERLRRGLITLADLPPHKRRAMVEAGSLDLHAIAAGPIMDAAEIYLPAGKLSMAETRERERRNLLP